MRDLSFVSGVREALILATKCPNCGYNNVSDFPFCESCLELLPTRPGNELAFELDVSASQNEDHAHGWPPFPWNPPDLEDRLIGRDKATGKLVEGWNEVVRKWTGRLHLLVSEFGMGKNQVVVHFAREAIRREPQAQVVRITCPEHGGPYRMWDVVLRALFDVPAEADPEEAGRLLLQAAEKRLPEEAREIVGLIADLVGYRIPGHLSASPSTDPEALVSRSAGALSRLLEAVARDPLLIIVTQADRGTSASLALAGSLEASLKGHPVMIVLTGTPELTQIQPGWHRFPATKLSPLSKRAAAEMIQLFLTGLDDIPVELTQRITERAKGSPWAIKSLLRYLVEGGAILVEQGKYVLDASVCWDLEWPQDLEGVVLARLNLLTVRDRAVLGNAAVVGETFWTGPLVALERFGVEPPDQVGTIQRDKLTWETSRSLDRLVALRFIQPRASSLSNEPAWAFRSALQWKVASTIVPSAARSRYHRIVEQWLRMHARADADPHLEDLARHAQLGGDFVRAADYNRNAARRALKAHEPRKSLEFLVLARAIISDDDRANCLELDVDLGDVQSRLGEVEDALASYHRALHAAWQLRHQNLGADVLMRIGRVETGMGRYADASRHSEAALRLYVAMGNRAGVAGVCLMLGKMLWLEGSHVEAMQSYRKADRLYVELEDRRGLAELADALAALQADRGELDLAERYFRRALELRRRLKDRRGVASSLNNLGVTLLGRGRPKEAIVVWREGLETASKMGYRSLQAALASNIGEALIKMELFDEAETALEEAIEWAREGRDPRVLTDLHLNRAVLRIRRGAWADAETEVEAARAYAKPLALPMLAGRIERVIGELHLARYRATDGGEAALLKRALKHLRYSIARYVEANTDLDQAESRECFAEALELAKRDDEAAKERAAAAQLRADHAPPEEKAEA